MSEFLIKESEKAVTMAPKTINATQQIPSTIPKDTARLRY